MPQFKVSSNRVTPLILKYFSYILWRSEDIDDDFCYFSYDYDDIGFSSEDESDQTLAKLKSILSLPITFNRKKEELAKEYHEEITFLIYFIKEVIHSSKRDDVVDSVYQDLINNYIKVRAFIKQYKLDNPDSSTNSTGLILEIKSKGKSQTATFDNLDLYYNFNNFLKSIEQQISIYIPEQTRKDLDNPDLSRNGIKKLITDSNIEIIDHTKFLKAKGVLLLQEYLLAIPPFNKEPLTEETLPANKQLLLTNDQIRLIYPLFEAMGWEEKADKKEAYIKKFRKRVIYHYNDIISSLP